MWDFVAYLPDVFTLNNTCMILAGTFVGLVFGAMPGLNPTMAVVLLVPVTFHMSPVVGIILLGSVYSGAVAGGAISAILINIPGAPPNVATVMDGYPMARRGDAQLALNLSFTASMAGGIIGCMVLLLFAVPLAGVAMSFRPAELFWTAIVGITVMSGLARDGLAKGLFSGCVGIMLSFVGLSSIHGSPRFIVFDSMISGVNFGTAMIGIFAIPQIFALVEELSAKKGEIVTYSVKRGQVREAFLELWRNPKAVFTASLVGTIIGIIPGAGGQIAGIVSYEQVKRSSSHPEKFGTGIPAGVIAAECANNAMVGPSLIPTLTMGIPGSATAAVLMGGLLIHGLYPGPDLFREHAPLTYTFMLAILFAQIPLGLFGIAMARYSHFVLRISNQTMIAAVLILSVFGAYAIQNSMEDVIIMFALGVIMHLAGKLGFIPAPLVLGLVLGSIVEENLLRGLMIAHASSDVWTYFCTGTINLIMIGVCIVSIGWSVWSEWVQHRHGSEQSGRAPVIRREVLIGLLMLATCAGLYWGAMDIESDEATFLPLVTIWVMAGLALVHLVEMWVKHRQHAVEKVSSPDSSTFGLPGTSSCRAQWLTFASMLLFLWLLERAGFYTTCFLYVLLLPPLLVEAERTLKAFGRRAIVAGVFTVSLYLLFGKFMLVQTPTGLLL